MVIEILITSNTASANRENKPAWVIRLEIHFCNLQNDISLNMFNGLLKGLWDIINLRKIGINKQSGG